MKPVLKKTLLVATVLAVLLLYYLFDARQGRFPQCPFYSLTGFHCPGCGSQRALSSLLHGDIFSALRYNSLLIVFLPLLLYAGIMNLRYAQAQKMQIWYNPIFGKMVLVIILAFWLLRNIPLSPFTILAPVK